MPRRRSSPEDLAARGSRHADGRKTVPADAAEPRTPRGLDRAGKALWRETCDKLRAVGLLSRTDAGALERYVRLCGHWSRLDAWVAEHGVVDADGSQNPQSRLMLQVADKLLRLEREFGLTPAGRNGLAPVAPAPAADDDDPVTRALRLRS